MVVTVNHRLNAFGYLYLAEFGGAEFADSGNAGMLDLVLALQWVRDNIAAFGGDAGNVTIFGQSGGGAKMRHADGDAGGARALSIASITMSGQQITASRVDDRDTACASSCWRRWSCRRDRVARAATLPMDAARRRPAARPRIWGR